MFKKYGWIAIGTYAAFYLTVFGSFYAGLSYGVDFTALLSKLGLQNLVQLDLSKLNTTGGKVMIAFVLTKLTGPFRILLVLFTTPMIARFLRRGVK